jgi:4-amino-4-deoxy-L-arabinose transferase-like glycosyltransferase
MAKVEKKVWLGRGLSLLAALPFLLSAAMKFKGGPEMAENWAKFGWPNSMLLTVAVLEILSVVLYLIPQVSILGAIVLTGYLGGAIATHLRLEQAVYLHVVIGLLIWGGLYLRDSRLRKLIPIVQKS